ncbi:Hypothetical_protein [Hexamita inflata]|uniref:Hypothetical_protein n=1 Tax=Hexamita inflata TaxID=28002 RepID=A0AA86TEL6_9EUKA|nr:Hypothetical protein HINF_LOCUS2941 [Hexamita inflata]
MKQMCQGLALGVLIGIIFSVLHYNSILTHDLSNINSISQRNLQPSSNFAQILQNSPHFSAIVQKHVQKHQSKYTKLITWLQTILSNCYLVIKRILSPLSLKFKSFISKHSQNAFFTNIQDSQTLKVIQQSIRFISSFVEQTVVIVLTLVLVLVEKIVLKHFQRNLNESKEQIQENEQIIEKELNDEKETQNDFEKESELKSERKEDESNQIRNSHQQQNADLDQNELVEENDQFRKQDIKSICENNQPTDYNAEQKYLDSSESDCQQNEQKLDQKSIETNTQLEQEYENKKAVQNKREYESSENNTQPTDQNIVKSNEDVQKSSQQQVDDENKNFTEHEQIDQQTENEQIIETNVQYLMNFESFSKNTAAKAIQAIQKFLPDNTLAELSGTNIIVRTNKRSSENVYKKLCKFAIKEQKPIIQLLQNSEDESQQLTNQIMLFIDLKHFPSKTGYKVLKYVKEYLKVDEYAEITQDLDIIVFVNQESVEDISKKISKMKIEDKRLEAIVMQHQQEIDQQDQNIDDCAKPDNVQSKQNIKDELQLYKQTAQDVDQSIDKIVETQMIEQNLDEAADKCDAATQDIQNVQVQHVEDSNIKEEVKEVKNVKYQINLESFPAKTSEKVLAAINKQMADKATCELQGSSIIVTTTEENSQSVLKKLGRIKIKEQILESFIKCLTEQISQQPMGEVNNNNKEAEKQDLDEKDIINTKKQAEEKQILEAEEEKINTQIIQEGINAQQIENSEQNKANKPAQVKLLVDLTKFPSKTAPKVLKCIKEMLKEEENAEINEKFVEITVKPENADEMIRKIGKMKIEGTKLEIIVQNGFEKGE